MKMHKSCCHQCPVLLAPIYASNHLSAGALPQTPLGELTSLHQTPSWFGGAAPGEREGGRGGGKEGGERRRRVSECPNPELASLC